jgi:DNA-directed RNA polymerase specialized sigma24 family protein
LSQKEVKALDEKLTLIARLLALELVKDLPKKEGVRALNIVGFTSSEIGELLGITPVTVRVTLFEIRRDEARTKARKARQTRK